MKQLEQMPARNPLNGTFELTLRCNLFCKMCMLRHDKQEYPAMMKQELTTEEWIAMAQQAAEAGTISLLLTGGEIMLREDFCQLYEAIYQMGFLLELYTNATMVTPKIQALLKKYPPHKIGVTLYGASKETYERVCKNGAAFAAAIEGIKFLRTLPSKLSIRTTVIKDNVADVPAMEQLVRELLGKEASLIHSEYVLQAIRGGCADVASCRLSPAESVQPTMDRFDRKVQRYCKEQNIPVPEYEYISETQKKNTVVDGRRISLFGCDAGMKDYVITWDGLLQGCQLLGLFYTDARKEGLVKAWEQYPFCVQEMKSDPACITCTDRADCGTCYGIQYAETGQLNKKADYFCELTRVLRAYRKKSV